MSTGNLAADPHAGSSSLLGSVGRETIAVSGYCGALVILGVAAIHAAGRVGVLSRKFRRSVVEELTWMVGMSWPIVSIISVGMGSFLSLQAYFGGMFADGTGAVVGVGLIRYLGPVVAGLTLSGLFAARITPELRTLEREQSRQRQGFLERTEPGKPAVGPSRETIPPERLVAARMVAGGICGFVMSVWVVLIGMVVGWRLASSLVGISTNDFFEVFFEMLWLRDVVGLFLKGAAFGAIAAWLASHEGLFRVNEPADFDHVGPTAIAACRSAFLSSVAVMSLSSLWFMLFYLTGTPFGPTLLRPPTS